MRVFVWRLMLYLIGYLAFAFIIYWAVPSALSSIGYYEFEAAVDADVRSPQWMSIFSALDFLIISGSVLGAFGASRLTMALRNQDTPVDGIRATFGFQSPKLRDMVVGVGAAAVMCAMAFLARAVAPGATSGAYVVGVSGFLVMPWTAAVLIADAILIRPFAEELVYRGWLYVGSTKPVISIVLPALVFAFDHVFLSAAGFAYVFMSGVVLGLVRYKTSRIWAPVAAHCLSNSVLTTAALL